MALLDLERTALCCLSSNNGNCRSPELNLKNQRQKTSELPVSIATKFLLWVSVVSLEDMKVNFSVCFWKIAVRSEPSRERERAREDRGRGVLLKQRDYNHYGRR
jgi:hypothetical protein